MTNAEKNRLRATIFVRSLTFFVRIFQKCLALSSRGDVFWNQINGEAGERNVKNGEKGSYLESGIHGSSKDNLPNEV
jgi:hypothetical protein